MTNKKFYTSIEKRGNDIYQRFVENGIRGKEIIAFHPELFIKGGSAQVAVDMKGNALNRIGFDTIRDAHDYIERYKGVDGFKVFGATDPIIQFVAKEYSNTIEFDASKIVGAIVDIEVASGNLVNGKYVPGPFPEPDQANYPISMLTVYNTKTKTFLVIANTTSCLRASQLHFQIRDIQFSNDQLQDFVDCVYRFPSICLGNTLLPTHERSLFLCCRQ